MMMVGLALGLSLVVVAANAATQRTTLQRGDWSDNGGATEQPHQHQHHHHEVWLVHLLVPETLEQTLAHALAGDNLSIRDKRQQVYDTLTAAFEPSQTQVVHALKTMPSWSNEWHIFPLWIHNTLVLRRPVTDKQAWRNNSASLWLEKLLALEQVRAVEKDEKVVQLVDSVQVDDDDNDDQHFVDAVEGGAQGNIRLVHAPELWQQQVEGQGVVVATIDSGVRFSHEALIENYRGTLNASTKTFNHDYAFWIPPSADPKQFTSDTADEVGHGTHVMGTLVGQHGIGVAPKSTWITARAFDLNGTATKSDFLMATQFVLCPTRFETQDLPDCARGADIISNSFGMSPSEQDVDKWKWMLEILTRWRQAGVLTVFSSGNTNGFKCSSVFFPGNSDQTLAVGALLPTGKSLWGASGKGPSVIIDGSGSQKTIVKPDFVAPGMAIRSALSIADTKYTRMTGTSMATPHVAGVLALLLSGVRHHSMDPANITAFTKETTFHRFHKPLLVPSTCGKTSYQDFPNNLYGWGMPNACQAASKLGLQCHEEELQRPPVWSRIHANNLNAVSLVEEQRMLMKE